MRFLLFRFGLAALVLAPATAFAGEPCKETADHCLKEMTRHYRNTGWVGISVEPEESGLFVVTKVWPKSPARKAGLEPGDVLLAFEGLPYRADKKAELEKVYKKVKVPGNEVSYTVRRDDRQLEVRIRLETVPDELLAHWIGGHMLHAHAEARVAENDP